MVYVFYCLIDFFFHFFYTLFFFLCLVDHLDLHVLTHSFPTRRSSDLQHADLRRRLVAHRIDRCRVGTNKDQTRVLHRLRKLGSLGQKSIAGMDPLSSRLLSGRKNRLDHYIGTLRRRRAGTHGFFSPATIQSFGHGVPSSTAPATAKALPATEPA